MLLYHNKREYSRVVEIVSLTEDGMFLKDKTPDDYGGAVLETELVHQVTFTDLSGYIEILKLENPAPMDKNKNPMTGNAILIDGKQYMAGTSPARLWETRYAAKLPIEYKRKAEITLGIMKSDGAYGTAL